MDEYVKTIPLDDCVEDDEYKKRLQACKDCLALYYESTCKYCGCFVRMRAKRKNKSCPYPGQDKWK
ncbi:MAG: hypothetical protein GX962_00745 [Epulopiscium sp.]|nr:hypothetical protein [Candidatus Epulonipiscium sp.]